MIAAAVITILGLLSGIAVVERTGLRMSGVIVVPLLAVYTLYTVSALPLFAVSALFAYVATGQVRRRTLVHGRQLLLTSLAFGAVVPVLWAVGTDLWSGSGGLSATAFFGTILPGIAAYNYHKLSGRERLLDLSISAATFAGLLLVGAALVSPSVATRLDPALTAILFSPSADVAVYRDAVRTTVPVTTAFPRAFSLAMIALGVVLSEGALSRWGVRVGGLIAIPLLAVFSLTNAWALPVYVGGAVFVYATITAINRLTLVYGRVLLTLGLAAGMVYALAVAAFTTTVVGFLLYFTAILSVMGAYNFHRMPPTERPVTVAVSVGLFALLLAIARVAVTPTPLGLLYSVTVMEAVAVLSALLLGGLAVFDLEHRRTDVAEHHAREVSPQ